MIKISLRNKLIIFYLCLLGPLIIFAGFLINKNVNFSKNQVINSTMGTSKIVQSNVDIFINDTKNLLLTLAQNPAVKSMNQRETMSTFIDAMSQQDSLLNLYAAHRDGKIFASVVWRGEDAANIADRDEFQEVLASGQPSLSKRILSRATGEMAVSLMVPIINDDGKITGVVGADISVRNLQTSLDYADKNRLSSIAITDENGVILVHSDYRYVYRKTSLAALKPFRLASRGRSGITSYSDQNGQVIWSAYLPTESFPGTVMVFLPDKAIQPPVRSALIRWLTALITVVVIMIVLSVLFVGRTTRPIQELVKATKGLPLDDNQRVLKEQPGDELGELAGAFNSMSEGLAAAHSRIAQHEQELRLLLSHLVKAQEDERSRIATDIHDGVTQMIVAALLESTAALNLLEVDAARSAEKFRFSTDLLSKSVTEMQRVIFNLRPPVLENLGLVPALRQQCSIIESIYNLNINFCVTGEIVKLDPTQEVMIYRIVQEGLSNAVKHSGASWVDVNLSYQQRIFNLSIIDNGCGFDTALSPSNSNSTSGLGLIAMKERAAIIGAQLNIYSKLGEGTGIELTMLL